MNLHQRDLVLLPVPFSNQTLQKVRPAIVISNNEINSTTEDVMLIPLTSVLKDAPYSVLLTIESLIEGKLPVASRARADKVFTAHKSLIQRKLGVVKLEIFEAIRQEVIKAIK